MHTQSVYSLKKKDMRKAGQMVTDGAKQLRAKDILTNANDTIINRGSTHGHYDHTMLRTAKLWEAYFERPIEPMDIAICMALVKLARIMETKSNNEIGRAHV